MSINSGTVERCLEAELEHREQQQDLSFWNTAAAEDISSLNAEGRIIEGEQQTSTAQSLGTIPVREGDSLSDSHVINGSGQGRVTGNQVAFLVHNSPEEGYPEGSASVASGTAESGGFAPADYCEGNNLELSLRREEQEPGGGFLLPNSLLNPWPWDQEVARPGHHSLPPGYSLEVQQQPHFGDHQQGPQAQAGSFQGYALQNQQVRTSSMVGPGAASGVVIPSSAKKIHKADREKLRRDKLNEHFVELAAVLDPERPKNDKARVLGDGLEVVRELQQEVKRLRVEHASLEEESKELVEEKGELREERAALRAEMEQLQVELYRRLLPCLGTSFDPSRWGGGLQGYAMPPPPPDQPPPQPAQSVGDPLAPARASSPPPQPAQAVIPPQAQPQSQQHQMPPPMPYPQHPPPGMPYMPLNPAAIAAYAAAAMQPYQHMLGMQPGTHPGEPHPYFPHNPYAQHPQYTRPPMPPPQQTSHAPPPTRPPHNVERPYPQYPPLPQPLLGMPSAPHPSYLSLLSAPQPHSSATAALAAGFGGGGVFPPYLHSMPPPLAPPPGPQHVPMQFQHPTPQNLHHPMASFPYAPTPPPPAQALGAMSAQQPPAPNAGQVASQQQQPPPGRGAEFWQFYQQQRAAGMVKCEEDPPRMAAEDTEGSTQQPAAATTRSGEPSSSATANRPWPEQEDTDGPGSSSARPSAHQNTQQQQQQQQRPSPNTCSPPNRSMWMPDQSATWPESSRSHFPSPPPPDPGV